MPRLGPARDRRRPLRARVPARGAGCWRRRGCGWGLPVTAADPFEYAILRVVPRVDRGEAMNAGVLLYCRPRGYLSARLALDEPLLLALDPEADVPGVHRALAAIAALCADAAPMPDGGDSPGGERPDRDSPGRVPAAPGLTDAGLIGPGLAGRPAGAEPYRAGSGGPG